MLLAGSGGAHDVSNFLTPRNAEKTGPKSPEDGPEEWRQMMLTAINLKEKSEQEKQVGSYHGETLPLVWGSFPRQSKRLSPLSLEFDPHVRTEDFTHHTHVKRVSQRPAESRGFSPGTPVSSHMREGWQGGLGHRSLKSPNRGVNWKLFYSILFYFWLCVSWPMAGTRPGT